MALRDQPYLPLYVQDFLTDEKLNMCSASAQGIYIKIMCVMHKSDPYGKILLKQNPEQNSSTTLNFAGKLAKLLPFDSSEILEALEELIAEEVLSIEKNALVQKRMVKDADVSDKRSSAGKAGGKKTQTGGKNEATASKFAQAKPEAKSEANPENEIEYEGEYENDNDKGGLGENLKDPSDFFEKIPLQELETELLTPSQWKDSIRREAGRAGFEMTEETLDYEIQRFFKIIHNDGESAKGRKDAKKHFNRWLMIEIDKYKKDTNGKQRAKFTEHVLGRTDI